VQNTWREPGRRDVKTSNSRDANLVNQSNMDDQSNMARTWREPGRRTYNLTCMQPRGNQSNMDRPILHDQNLERART